jgi:hypothetical protein
MMDNARCLQWQPIVIPSDARRSNNVPHISAPLARSGAASPITICMHSAADRSGNGVAMSRGTLGVGSGGFRRYDWRLLASNSIARAGALLEVERRCRAFVGLPHRAVAAGGNGAAASSVGAAAAAPLA